MKDDNRALHGDAPHTNAKNLQPITTPVSVYASAIQCSFLSNDFTFVLGRTSPVLNEQGTISETAVVVLPTAILSMSPQTAKDLYLSLKNLIPQYEERFGTLTTTYSEQLKNRL